MKLKITHYYLALLFATLLVLVGLSAAYYSSTYNEPSISNAGTNATILVKKNADTLLSVQVAEDSGCDASGVLLDEAELLTLPQHQFTTLHTWASEPETFSGPLLQDILEIVCENTQSIALKALNDYSVTIDFSKSQQYKPIVAHSINGKRLSIREKGPLWVMFDHERHNIASKAFEAMMIWQLSDITILQANEKN